MKKLLCVLFIASTVASYGQSDSSRVKAIGIDFFKNIPFLFLRSEGYRRPLFLDGVVLLRAQRPFRYYHLSAGYADVSNYREQRIWQNVQGGYLKFGKEFNKSLSLTNFFWGYAGAISWLQVQSKLAIKGNIFEDYTAPLPDYSGMGISAELFLGADFRVAKRLRARLLWRSAAGTSNVGAPNAFYLPGAGIRIWNEPFILTGGITLQCVYVLAK